MTVRLFLTIALGLTLSAPGRAATGSEEEGAVFPPVPETEYRVCSATLGEEGDGTVDEPMALPGRLRLKDALALTLLNNPELAAHEYAVEGAEALTLQAGFLPNPELEVEVEDFWGDGEAKDFDAAETTVLLSQLIELGGKRGDRERVAGAEEQISRLDLTAARLNILAETTDRFIGLLAAQEKLLLSEEKLEIAEEVRRIVSERVAAGKDAPLEQVKSEGETAAARIALKKSRGELAAARARLAAMWGGEAADFSEALGDLSEIAPVLPSQTEILSAIDNSPDLARAEVMILLAQNRVSAEKGARVPDLHLAVGGKRNEAERDESFVAGVGIELPLFDRNQGGVRSARANLAKAGRERDSVRNTIRKECIEAYRELTVARGTFLDLRADLLPAASEAFRVAREGYRAGKFGYLDILDAQRRLFESRAELLDAGAAYFRAILEIERLTSTGFDSFGRLQSGGKSNDR